MTTAPLLTISAFARAVGLAPSTLRYYDEAGLLPPAEVDPQTGYRYYTPDLERRALLVSRMRDAGAPVELMRAVLDGSADEGARLLRAYAAEVAHAARATFAAVEDVVGRLPGTADPGPVRVEVDAGLLAAAVRRTVPAASAEPDGPLSAVLLEVSPNGLDVVATDRYWLVCRTVAVVEPAPTRTRRLVLSAKDAEAVAGWLSRHERVCVELAVGGLRLVFGDDEAGWEAAPDRFPAHRMLLEGQPPARGRCDLPRAVVLGLLDDEASPVRLTVGEDRVWVSGPSREGVRLPATTAGDPVTLHFASALLCKVLEALAGEDVRVAYVAPDRAVRFTGLEQPGVVVLAMPTLEQA
jgi:DNA-binding transcriptional MerR regulator